MGRLIIPKTRDYLYIASGTGLSPNIDGLRFYDTQSPFQGQRTFYDETNKYLMWRSATAGYWFIKALPLNPFTPGPSFGKISSNINDPPTGNYIGAGSGYSGTVTISEYKNKISIKKTNSGGGKAIIKQHNNLFTCPFNMDTLECPSSGFDGPGWLRGSQVIRFGKTIAPDGTNTAVEYQSNSINSCYVSQGYLSYWRPNTKYIISVWAKLTSGNFINGTIINATRN